MGGQANDDDPFADDDFPPIGRKQERPKRSTERAALHEILSSPETELWLAHDGTAMISVGTLNFPVKSREFDYFIQARFVKTTGEAPGATRREEAASLAIAGAINSGQRHQAWNRWARLSDGRIVCDLGGAGDPQRGFVVVGPNGWKFSKNIANTKFLRKPDALALPIPESDAANAEVLCEFVSFAAHDDLQLAWAWLVCAARPGANSYPIAALSGLQGSGKSSAARRLQDLIDPSSVTGRGLPREERDLAAAIATRHLISFDNVSVLQQWLSDALSRVATGAGFAARRLHTDADEHLIFGARPIILNGIADIYGRADLADRTLRIELVPPEERQTDEELERAWISARPGLFGLLLDGLVAGLRLFDKTELDGAPRMASQARWAAACASGLGLDGQSIAPAWRANRDAGDRAIVEGDDVAAMLVSHIKAAPEGVWRGTAAQLLTELTERASVRVARGRDWPANASSLGLRLTRLVPALRSGAGIDAIRARSGPAGARIWTFRKL